MKRLIFILCLAILFPSFTLMPMWLVLKDDKFLSWYVWSIPAFAAFFALILRVTDIYLAWIRPQQPAPSAPAEETPPVRLVYDVLDDRPLRGIDLAFLGFYALGVVTIFIGGVLKLLGISFNRAPAWPGYQSILYILLGIPAWTLISFLYLHFTIFYAREQARCKRWRREGDCTTSEGIITNLAYLRPAQAKAGEPARVAFLLGGEPITFTSAITKGGYRLEEAISSAELPEFLAEGVRLRVMHRDDRILRIEILGFEVPLMPLAPAAAMEPGAANLASMDSPPSPTPGGEAIAPPPGDRVVVRHSPQGFELELAPPGVIALRVLLEVGYFIVILPFVALLPFVLTITYNGVFGYVMTMIVSSAAGTAWIALILYGLNLACRRARITVAGGRLVVEETRLLGSPRRREWGAGEVAAIRLLSRRHPDKGWRTVALEIHARKMKVSVVLIGRDRAELEWASQVLSKSLAVPVVGASDGQ